MNNKLISFNVALNIFIFLFCNTSFADTNESNLWRALSEGNHIALLRHALAPGFGDPDHFSVDDCATQRNLDDVGRKQAISIGQRFRENGIEQAKVFTSQWCRCIDTAHLLNLGKVRELPALNSFFQRFELREQRTNQLKKWLKSHDTSQPTVLVTHQVNITALTGVVPNSGEMVVITLDDKNELTVLGTLMTNY